MPVTRFSEGIARHFDRTSFSREYYFHGPATEFEVNAFIATAISPFVEGLPRNPENDTVDEVDEIEGDWRATLHWGVPSRRSPQAAGTVEYKFNFQAPSAHVKQSLATISSTARAGEVAPNHGGAINVVEDKDGPRVEGQQIGAPPETFTISYSFEQGAVGNMLGYQGIVERRVGTVNDALYKGRAAGSLMLVRASGGKTGDGTWNIEFGFSFIANLVNIVVGDFLVAAKDGHDLLWVYYGQQADANAKRLIVPPVAAYVERVWYRSNFDSLDLPDPA